MNKNIWPAAGLALLLGACGGGSDSGGSPGAMAQPQALAQQPRPLSQPQPQASTGMTAAQRNVALLHQAAYGRALSNASYASTSALADSNLQSLLSSVNTDLASLNDIALALRVTANLSVTDKSTSPEVLTNITVALTQLFAAYGKASRAAIVLNAAIALNGLEADATWGKAAKLLNTQVAANHAYSSDATHLVWHAVTPGGSAASNLPVYGDCLNPALYTTGASYQINIATPGMSSLVVSTTVGPRVNFRGNDTADLSQSVSGVTTAGQSSVLKYHYYHDVTDAGFVDAGFVATVVYGSYGEITITNVYGPVSRIPATLVTNGSYSETVTATTIVSVPALNTIPPLKDFNVVQFQGVEQLTTPAGTFAACKRKVTRSGGDSSSDTIWTVADGRFKGMQLKFVDQAGVAQTTTKLTLNGSSQP